MLLGWIRPDRWRRIDAVIDYFGDPREARVAKIRRASPATRASLTASARAARPRPPHTAALLRTALLVHGARS